MRLWLYHALRVLAGLSCEFQTSSSRSTVPAPSLPGPLTGSQKLRHQAETQQIASLLDKRCAHEIHEMIAAAL